MSQLRIRKLGDTWCYWVDSRGRTYFTDNGYGFDMIRRNGLRDLEVMKRIERTGNKLKWDWPTLMERAKGEL